MTEEVSKNFIKNANDVQILKVNLINHAGVKIDCSNLWVNIEIYESIHSNVLTGSLTIHDKMNISRNAPVIGQEKIEISYKTPSVESIIKTFVVYDVPVKQRIPGKDDVLITFQFTSIQNQLSSRKLISKSYNNKKLTDMVKLIFEDYLTDNSSDESGLNNNNLVTIEDTLPKTSLVIPRWTPLQTINWICSTSEWYGNCDYVFFEGMESFYFAPLANLKLAKPTTTYKYTTEKVSLEIGKDVNEEIRKIITYSESQSGNNKYEMEVEGVFASTTISHDTTYKTVEYNNFYYWKDFQEENVVKLSKEPIAPMTYASKISGDVHTKVKNKSSYMFDNIRTQYEPTHYQKRTSQMLRNNAKNLKIEINGDCRRRAGEVLTINIPSTEFLPAKNREELLDGHLSGNYLVTSVGHHISKQDGYFMGLELVRDSFQEAYPDYVSITSAG
jgi:hypothetical protein